MTYFRRAAASGRPGASGDVEAGPEVGGALLEASGAGPELEAGAEARGGAS